MLRGLLGSGYMLPAQAEGTVTDCIKYGPGDGTLQAALVEGGEVTFGCSGTIIVPQITLDADATINTTGQNVTLSGNNTNLVLLIREGWKVDLINLTITQGTRGGIWNRGGMVTLNNCTVSGNNSTETLGGSINNFFIPLQKRHNNFLWV